MCDNPIILNLHLRLWDSYIAVLDVRPPESAEGRRDGCGYPPSFARRQNIGNGILGFYFYAKNLKLSKERYKIEKKFDMLYNEKNAMREGEKNMGMKTSAYGKTADGKQVTIVTVVNDKGMGMEVMDYGATLVSVTVPGKDGKLRDVVLGYDDVADYMRHGGYLGATIGRNGNRIGKSVVTIGGKEYQMDKNEGENDLHSGFHGFDKRIWEMEFNEDKLSVTFKLHSPDGDQGLPGNVDVKVTYTLTEENAIQIHYEGRPDADTILNMTNHSYFNLDGHDSGDVLKQKLWLDADAYTVVDAESIPTGENASVEGTPMDFRIEKTIGRDIEDDFEQLKLTDGYDHNFVLNHQGEGIRRVAKGTGAQSGIVMEVYTDLPGVQFYTANFVTPEQIGKGGCAYDKRTAFCLETQVYPDANHHENFPTSIVKAGEKYETTTIYRFSLEH